MRPESRRPDEAIGLHADTSLSLPGRQPGTRPLGRWRGPSSDALLYRRRRLVRAQRRLRPSYRDRHRPVATMTWQAAASSARPARRRRCGRGQGRRGATFATAGRRDPLVARTARQGRFGRRASRRAGGGEAAKGRALAPAGQTTTALQASGRSGQARGARVVAAAVDVRQRALLSCLDRRPLCSGSAQARARGRGRDGRGHKGGGGTSSSSMMSWVRGRLSFVYVADARTHRVKG
ncbi:hypothetical protein CDD83_5874 [Cordyceps sp. RAO-2017]|nr:hypothetical protein CDD83_5874 [Cordyceps sp. RAO-2017]